MEDDVKLKIEDITRGIEKKNYEARRFNVGGERREG